MWKTVFFFFVLEEVFAADLFSAGFSESSILGVKIRQNKKTKD
jgi:hypothetical protein